MTAAIAALAVALGIAVVMLVRERRGRAEREDAVARRLRDAVPRSELSEARAGRDALMAAVPSPVLVFDAGRSSPPRSRRPSPTARRPERSV
jgi:hypothetical protein